MSSQENWEEDLEGSARRIKVRNNSVPSDNIRLIAIEKLHSAPISPEWTWMKNP